MRFPSHRPPQRRVWSMKNSDHRPGNTDHLITGPYQSRPPCSAWVRPHVTIEIKPVAGEAHRLLHGCRRPLSLPTVAAWAGTAPPRLRLVVVADDDTGPRLCRGCGGLLMRSAKATAAFCSSACRSRHWRRMRRTRARTEAMKASVTSNCPACGTSWAVGVERPASARYCSPRCRKRAWRRRRMGQGGCEAAHPAAAGPLHAPGPYALSDGRRLSDGAT